MRKARQDLQRYLECARGLRSDARRRSSGARPTPIWTRHGRRSDAYTEDKRVIGNTLLAQAREHSNVVERSACRPHARPPPATPGRHATSPRPARPRPQGTSIDHRHRRRAPRHPADACSCFAPSSRRSGGSIAPWPAMIAGRYDVDIPPAGDDEIGTMARTLALFRDSNAERRAAGERIGAPEARR